MYPVVPRAIRRLAPSRRWFQFSLRTLLLAVTAVCLVLGFVSKPIVEARREQPVIDALRGVGADVGTQTARFPGAFAVRLVLGEWVCRRADYVVLTGRPIGDEDLRHVASLRHVRSLYLGQTGLGDAGLAHLRELDELWGLDLGQTEVTDAGLKNLSGLDSLLWLNLAETGIGDAGLAHLRDLDELSQLDLRGTQVTDAGLEHLTALDKLVSISTFGTRVTYEGLERLEAKLPLARFREQRAIYEIGAIGGQLDTRSAFVEHETETAFYETACQAYLDGTRMSGDALPHVRYLPSLERAELLSVELGEEGLAPLAELPALESLELWMTEVDEDDLRCLGQVKSLRKLSFHHNEMTDQGLEHLEDLNRLETLEFHQTRVTEDAVKLLRQALPDCDVQAVRDD